MSRGAFSIVKDGTNKKTGEKVAVKYIEKKYVQEKHIEQLRREIAIMTKVDHKNVSVPESRNRPKLPGAQFEANLFATCVVRRLEHMSCD